MSPRRQIACWLTSLGAAFLLLGCGSGDPTSAEIDPVIGAELGGQLDRIEDFFEDRECDRAAGAVDTLREALDARSDENGEEFTASAQELAVNLGEKVEDECEPIEEETSTTTEVDSVPTTTTTEEESVPTTTTRETTTTDDDDETTTPDPPPTPVPPTDPGNGNGNGPPENPGGGITPGKQGGGR